MGYAIRIEWMEELKTEKWINHGRDVAEESCKHKDQDPEKQETNMRYSGYCEECDIMESSCYPMINCIYPLELKDFDKAKIKEVIKRTDCTVVENDETGEWFLTLCGGGMDLSQDIALAYFILERRIPFDLVLSVCTQKELSLNGKDWAILKKAMNESLNLYLSRIHGKLKEWE
jgi:hypothetical protein